MVMNHLHPSTGSPCCKYGNDKNVGPWSFSLLEPAWTPLGPMLSFDVSFTSGDISYEDTPPALWEMCFFNASSPGGETSKILCSNLFGVS